MIDLEPVDKAFWQKIPMEDHVFFFDVQRKKFAYRIYERMLKRANELGCETVRLALHRYLGEKRKSLLETGHILDSSSTTIQRYYNTIRDEINRIKESNA